MRELFTENELRSLLQQDEGQFLEFKSLWDLAGSTRKVIDRRTVRDMIAECIAAFANADGGTLLLGMDDDGSPTGHGYPEEAITEFLAVPQRRLRPAVVVRHQRIALNGNEIIAIQVGIAARGRDGRRRRIPLPRRRSDSAGAAGGDQPAQAGVPDDWLRSPDAAGSDTGRP